MAEKTLQRHNTENSKQIFSRKKLRGYSPNSYIHVSVSDLHIPQSSDRSAYSAAGKYVGGPILGICKRCLLHFSYQRRGRWSQFKRQQKSRAYWACFRFPYSWLAPESPMWLTFRKHWCEATLRIASSFIHTLLDVVIHVVRDCIQLNRHQSICQRPFKKGQQMGSAAFSVPFCRHALVCCFLGWWTLGRFQNF